MFCALRLVRIITGSFHGSVHKQHDMCQKTRTFYQNTAFTTFGYNVQPPEKPYASLLDLQKF